MRQAWVISKKVFLIFKIGMLQKIGAFPIFGDY